MLAGYYYINHTQLGKALTINTWENNCRDGLNVRSSEGWLQKHEKLT